MYHVIISPKAKKDLKSLPERYKEAIRNMIREMKDNPTVGKALARDLTGKYSYRIGVFRVIYRINKKDKTVYILTVGHRFSVYQ